MAENVEQAQAPKEGRTILISMDGSKHSVHAFECMYVYSTCLADLHVYPTATYWSAFTGCEYNV